MKCVFFVIILALFTNNIAAQKPIIDTSVLGKWPSIIGPAISSDGNYGSYDIYNQSLGSHTLVVKSIHSNWRLEVPDAFGRMTANSRSMIFKVKDTLGIALLGSSSVEYIPGIVSFKLPNSGTGEWLAYQLDGGTKELVLYNLTTNNRKYFTGVKGYLFNEDGKILVIQTEQKKDSIIEESMRCIDLENDKNTIIWEGIHARRLVFDKSATQLAFTATTRAGDRVVTSLWYYKKGAPAAIQIANDQSIGMGKGLLFNDVVRFSNEGRSIFFLLKEKQVLKAAPKNAIVDIWSYTDAKLQSQQLKEVGADQTYIAVIHMPENKVILLEEEEGDLMLPFSTQQNEEFVLIRKGKGDVENEWHWNKAAQSSVYLVSVMNGSRKLLDDKLPASISLSYRLSPDGKYVIYYNADGKNYFAYEISTGKSRNLTKNISGTWTLYEKADVPIGVYCPIGIAAWVAGEESVLVYERNDVFKVDMKGNLPPVNLTNGYGHKCNIVFRLAMDDPFPEELSTIKSGELLVLSAFNRNNKEDGFYSIVVGKLKDPSLLTMGPYIYRGPDESDHLLPVAPIKAKDAHMYLVRRMSAEEAPNFFCTADFKNFTRLSDLHPEKLYNWLTTTLVNWKTLDGSLSQGILFKPEDFDPKKKYPIIFYYYERLSEGLHEFILPEMSIGSINIPYYVSNGYLVFTPDIHYKIGHPGNSAVNSIVSAAKYLAKLPWVDSTRMGIQGHSRGGYQTNYVITHTNIFAAAMSSSGMSDYISLYGGIRTNGVSRQSGEELHFQRIGATLWQRPDLFIENSPIFKIDKVTTPLLMMNNKMDSDVPFMQGVEFFTGLRRLGKKAWMLQYDSGDHMVFGDAATDLTIRMKQFFDHYLKGIIAPIWMTRGVPAKMKGQENGLGLDDLIKTPQAGLMNEKPIE